MCVYMYMYCVCVCVYFISNDVDFLSKNIIDIFWIQEIRPSSGGGGGGTGGASMQKAFGVLIFLLGIIAIAFS